MESIDFTSKLTYLKKSSRKKHCATPKLSNILDHIKFWKIGAFAKTSAALNFLEKWHPKALFY